MTQPLLKQTAIGLVACFSMLGSVAIQAQAKTVFDISFSSDNAKLGVYQKETFADSKQRYGIEYHHAGDQGDMISAIAEITRSGFEQAPNLDIGFKGKGYFVDPESRIFASGSGLMLGIIASYWLPTPTPAFVSAEFLYGPNVLSFGNVDDAREFGVRLEAKLLDTASAYIGYRQIQMDINARTLEFEDAFHVGFKLAF